MAQYISKDSLVAEIKRLINCCYKICAGNLDFLQKSYPEHYYSIETYKEILSFIDTLEVKEVDLEKELESWRHNHFHGRRDKDASGEYLERVSQLDLAKHFFELGISVGNKAQRGE